MTIGSAHILGVQDAGKKKVGVPKDLGNFESNSILKKNIYPPFEINVPPNIRVSLVRKRWDLNHLSGKTRCFSILFEDAGICRIEIKISPVGFSLLQGRESSLKENKRFPDNLNGHHIFDYQTDIEVTFTEPLFFRLGIKRNRPKIHYYYLWCKAIIEGMEKDFCYPIPFAEQDFDWKF